MPYDATLLQHFPNDVLRRLTSAQVFQRFGHAAPPPPRRARRSRLGVGYLSFDFREHPMGASRGASPTTTARTGRPRTSARARRARYCNFNQIDKYEPESFTLWMGALRRSPGATLALLRPKEPLGAVVVANLAAEAAARGVHPAPRLARRARQAHLTRMAETCDLFLDNLVYGAHTTGADSLWAAVPLLAIRGFGGGGGVGRFASSVSVPARGRGPREFDVGLPLPPRGADLGGAAGPPCFGGDDPDADERAASSLPPVDGAARRRSSVARFAAAYPEDANARSFRGLDCHFAGDDAAAAAELRHAVDRAPWSSHFWYNLGHVRRRAGDAAGAAAAYLSGLRVRDDGDVAGNLNEALRAAAPDDARLLGALFASSALSPSDAGLRLGVGAALRRAGWRAALEEWFKAVRLRHAAQRADERGRARLDARDAALAKRAAARRGNLVVAIYCDEYGQAWPDWGPSSLETGGLGGSEEAVVFVARELAKRGHAVEVYNECADRDLGDDRFGVAWLRHATYDASRPPDAFVAWRYHVSTAVADPATHGKVYAWLQDAPGAGRRASQRRLARPFPTRFG
ncbi:protein N-acetylglucosaminyltransferase [Aureococcus anophagefferens]|nr:protein N-acetylglucosaminyltransferase [Aureococcus anophagefferens]